MWSIFWPDLLHKLARKASLALTRSGSSEWLKKMNKLFRMSLGPWGSGRFGKELQHARSQLLDAIKNGSLDPELLQTWLLQVARDQKQDESSFGVADLIRLLEKKSGEVFETIDIFWIFLLSSKYLENHCRKAPAGSAHVRAEEHKDVRWFSFYDHSASWDKVFHLEMMVHQFCWWCEGRSPWHLQDQSSGNGQSESYSSRIFAFNATRHLKEFAIGNVAKPLQTCCVIERARPMFLMTKCRDMLRRYLFCYVYVLLGGVENCL